MLAKIFSFFLYYNPFQLDGFHFTMAYVIFYHCQLKLHADAEKSAKSANLGLLCYVSIFKKGLFSLAAAT